MAEQKEGSGTVNVEGDAGDGEFEPTVEMLVNDFDDERTLDEEEALEERENQEEEIDNLTKEQNMPIEQLLAIYGAYNPQAEGEAVEANGEVNEGENENNEDVDVEGEEVENEVEEADDGDAATSRSSGSDENVHNSDIYKDTKVEGSKPERRKREKPSELVHLYPELDANGDSAGGATSRSLRSGSRQQSEDEEEEGEEASGEEEEDWRKTIMIGSAYQAQVPEGLQAYGDTPPYENEDRLLWEPNMVTPDQVENYLNTFSKRNKSAQGINSLPLGTHVRDDEFALHLLLQCGYNVDEALRRHKMNPNKPVSQMTLWSEEECRNFENGLKTYGKDFHLIQQNKVRTRSVGELVQFYYLWKKTERHDMFATKTRIEKKKYIVHPGTTDYMDRFLDEGEGVSLTSTYVREAPGIHALLYGKCPPGVAAPIPSSTIASATIAFVSATPPASLPHETKTLLSLPTLTSITASSVPFHSLPADAPPISRSGSPRSNALPPCSQPVDGVLRKIDYEANALNIRTSKALCRGTKRPLSPSIDLKASLSQPLAHTPLSLCADKQSIPIVETVAL